MRFLLCAFLSVLLISCGDNDSSSGSSNNRNPLPEVDFQIETVVPVISGANSRDITANNGPSSPITVNLSVNSPYSLRVNQLTFLINAYGFTDTQSFTILYDTRKISEETIRVTWQ